VGVRRRRPHVRVPARDVHELAVGGRHLLPVVLPAGLPRGRFDGAAGGDSHGPGALARRRHRRARGGSPLRRVRLPRHRAADGRRRRRRRDEPRLSGRRRSAAHARRRRHRAADGETARRVVPRRGGLRAERSRRHVQPPQRCWRARDRLDRRRHRLAGIAVPHVGRRLALRRRDGSPRRVADARLPPPRRRRCRRADGAPARQPEWGEPGGRRSSWPAPGSHFRSAACAA
jgi:hypothetical protein